MGENYVEQVLVARSLAYPLAAQSERPVVAGVGWVFWSGCQQRAETGSTRNLFQAA